MKKFYLLLLLVTFPLVVNANEKFSIDCDKLDKININEQIVCRVSVNSNFSYDKINFNISESDKFEIVDVRSNYEKIWTVKNDNLLVTSTAKNNQSGLQEFAIILIKTLKDGVNELNLKNISIENTSLDEVKEFEDISITLKVISSNNLLNYIVVNDEEIDNFDANKTSYDYYIDDDEVINILASASNEFAIINGMGEFVLDSNVGKFIFPITVTSEDGVNKIYTLNVIRNNFKDNNINKSLDFIKVTNDKGSDLLIGFKKDIYEYNIDVSLDTKFLDIKPEFNNDNLSLVKGYGNTKIELKSGANIVLIKVKDNEGQVLNYVLNITKPLANKSSNNYIKSLEIKKYKLSFSKRVKNYTLEINSNDKVLDINPILESDTASYVIVGNNNLKDGSVVRIIVTAENEEKATYKINIKVKKTNYAGYFILIIGIGIAWYLIYKYKSILSKKINGFKTVNKKKTTNVKSKANSNSVKAKKETIKNKTKANTKKQISPTKKKAGSNTKTNSKSTLNNKKSTSKSLDSKNPKLKNTSSNKTTKKSKLNANNTNFNRPSATKKRTPSKKQQKKNNSKSKTTRK